MANIPAASTLGPGRPQRWAGGEDGGRALGQPWRFRNLALPTEFGPAVVAVSVTAWAVATVLFESARLVIHAPQAQVAVETMSGVCRLFGALVLVLVATGADRERLRWTAAGLVVLALGNVGFGMLWQTAFGEPSANESMYAFLAVSTVSGGFFVAGLVPRRAPRLTTRAAIAGGALFGALSLVVVAAAGNLPRLVQVDTFEAAIAAGRVPLDGLTAWHWLLSALPLLLAAAAAIGALRHAGEQPWGPWLAAAMIVLTGALLHNALWPSAYSSVLTSGDLLRLAFAGMIALGGTLELRRLAAERETLLEFERRQTAWLVDLASLKGDYGRMVAHELVSPITAIRAYLAILAMDRTGSRAHDRALLAIQAETDLLQALVHDVRAIATVERDDFSVDLRPIPIAELLADAADFNHTLVGHHPLLTVIPASVDVLADPARIKQVLRNLIGNAAKYSPPGVSIEVRALRRGNRVAIEVVDHGPGIPVGEEAHVFEKFARGSRDRQRIPGFGLGLYLSRRIVRAHGSDLVLETTPGGGATLRFDLEVVQVASQSAAERLPPKERPTT